MDHMIKVTSKDLIHAKCVRITELVEDLEEQLGTHDKYKTNLKQIGALSHEFSVGNWLMADELRQAIKIVESSPAKR